MCIKLVNYLDKFTEMHGQRNVKKRTKWLCISYKPANGELIDFRTVLTIFNVFNCLWH